MAEKSTFDARDLVEEHRLGGSRVFCVVYSGQRSWVVELPAPTVLAIGRSPASDLVLDDDRVSRQHARIESTPEGLRLRDLGSRNGTRVNGKRVEGARRLRSGDEIAIGSATLVVGITSAGFAGELSVLGHAAFEDRLAAELQRAQCFDRPASLAMFRVGAGSGDETNGAVRTLGAMVREADALGLYGPGEIEVLLVETPEAQAEYFVERAISNLAVQTRAGVTVFPRDATTRDRLVAQARRALAAAVEAKRPWARPPSKASAGGRALLAVDPATRRLVDLIDRVCARDITVLLLGETGAGKGIVAQEIHRRGPRAKRPLVTVNCGSIPPTLIEAELFGHEKGAFTGAAERKAGYFEAAEGGTLFLDEIAEIPIAMQSRLLRALDERSITRVGGTRPLAIDVRIIAATHRTLEEEVKGGRFREDLYFRLSAFPIAIPPLRDRPADLAPLATQFTAEFAQTAGRKPPRWAPASLLMLRRHQWPGNVRELRNAVERAVVLCGGGASIEPEHLPERLHAPAGADGELRDRVERVERTEIERALRMCDGNRTQAARALGLSRRSLIYKIQKYRLARPA